MPRSFMYGTLYICTLFDFSVCFGTFNMVLSLCLDCLYHVLVMQIKWIFMASPMVLTAIPCVIPKSCHHHVIRLLTFLLAPNPNTWSGNSYHFVNLSQKCLAPCLPLCPRVVPCSTTYPLLSTSGATTYVP